MVQEMSDSRILGRGKGATHRNLLRELALETGCIPSSILLEGVTCEGRVPERSGGFSDIFRGQYQGKTVALKRPRVDRKNGQVTKRGVSV